MATAMSGKQCLLRVTTTASCIDYYITSSVHRVYDSRHLQADCQQPGSAPEPYALRSALVWATFTFLPYLLFSKTGSPNMQHHYYRWSGEEDRVSNNNLPTTTTTTTAYLQRRHTADMMSADTSGQLTQPSPAGRFLRFYTHGDRDVISFHIYAG